MKLRPARIAINISIHLAFDLSSVTIKWNNPPRLFPRKIGEDPRRGIRLGAGDETRALYKPRKSHSRTVADNANRRKGLSRGSLDKSRAREFS